MRSPSKQHSMTQAKVASFVHLARMSLPEHTLPFAVPSLRSIEAFLGGEYKTPTAYLTFDDDEALPPEFLRIMGGGRIPSSHVPPLHTLTHGASLPNRPLPNISALHVASMFGCHTDYNRRCQRPFALLPLALRRSTLGATAPHLLRSTVHIAPSWISSRKRTLTSARRSSPSSTPPKETVPFSNKL